MGTNEQEQQVEKYKYEDEKHIEYLKKIIENLNNDLKRINSYPSIHFHNSLIQSLNEIKAKVEENKATAEERRRQDKPVVFGNEYLMKIEEFLSFLGRIETNIQASRSKSLGIGMVKEKQAQESKDSEEEILEEIKEEFKALTENINNQIKGIENKMKKISEDKNRLIHDIITKLKKFESNILDGNKEKFDREIIRPIIGFIIPAGPLVLFGVYAFSSALLIALPYVVTLMLISAAALVFISTYDSRKKSNYKKIIISRLDKLSTNIKEAQRKGEKFALPLKEQKEIVEELSKLSRMYPGGPFDGKYSSEDLFRKIFNGKEIDLYKEVIYLIEHVKNVRLNNYKQGNKNGNNVHIPPKSQVSREPAKEEYNQHYIRDRRESNNNDKPPSYDQLPHNRSFRK